MRASLASNAMAHKASSGGAKPKKTGGGERHGEDRSEADLIDRRKGAYDNVVPRPAHPRREHVTPHEAAQWGADVRAKTEPDDESTPERLRRMKKQQ